MIIIAMRPVRYHPGVTHANESNALPYRTRWRHDSGEFGVAWNERPTRTAL